MKIAISFLCTEFKTLKDHWTKNSVAKEHTGTHVGLGGIKANEKGIEPFIGGAFIVLDWEKKQKELHIDVDGAGGFEVNNNSLIINNMRLNYISVFELSEKRERKQIHNKLFNCLHSLHRTSQGYLVSSTGIDSIIEVDFAGNVIFEWMATEHGFSYLPNGEKRSIDRSLCHHEYVYPTLSQTTHVNSAFYLDDNFILATLFHQGFLVKIDRLTGECITLLDGLLCPHGAKKCEHSWVLPNSKANNLLVLDSNFKVADSIEGDYNWIQDVLYIGNNRLLIADSNHSRIVEIDMESKKIITDYEFSENWRIYQLSILNQ